MVLCAASTGSKTCCPLAAMVREFEEVVGGKRMRTLLGARRRGACYIARMNWLVRRVQKVAGASGEVVRKAAVVVVVVVVSLLGDGQLRLVA